MTRRVRFTPFLCAGVFLATEASVLRAAEVPFAARPPIATSADGARAVTAADVDGDGDLDVLSASSVDNRLAWYANTAGDGSAWTAHTIAVSASAQALATADVDHDGDLDLFSTGPADGALLWHENTAGDGSAWSTQLVASGLSSPRALAAADVDRDGRTDVLVVGGTAASGSVAWYENAAGNGSVWTAHAVSTALAGGWAAGVGDLDGDGDPDLLSASRDDDTLAWYENVGGAGASFARRVISATADGASAVDVADVDRDGDLDVLAVSTFDGTLAWHSNDAGNGSLWSAHAIATGLGAPLALHAADLDGDGDVDALSASQAADSVVWADNLGSGSSWTLRSVAVGPDNPLSVSAADVDGDGDLDVLAASFLDDAVAWRRNETLHRNACFRAPALIAVPPPGETAVVTGLVADIDRDGAQDVAWGSRGMLAWERNVSGQGDVWSRTTVASGLGGHKALRTGDVDRDGDLDLVGLAGDYPVPPRVDWYAQPAAGAWPVGNIVSNAFGAGSEDVSLADIDGDGDLDVFASRPYASNSGWQENAGNGSGWATHVMGGAPTSAVALADVDGDGDLDAYVVWYDATTDRRVAWRSNLDGLGTLSAPNLISLALGNTHLHPADLDGDGTPDVVAHGGVWLNPNGGSGFAQVALPGVRPSGAAIADFDRDGDLDLAKQNAGAADWAENLLGHAQSWGVLPLPSSDPLTAVFAGDIDGDGDADLGLGTSTRLEWRRNDGGQAALAAANLVPPSPANGELVPLLRLDLRHLGRTGDSDLELVSLGLLFEEGPGDPLTTAEANLLIEGLRVYRDANGNGVFEPGVDALVSTLGTLALVAGVQTLSFTDADPQVQVPAGASRTFFAVAELTADASTQVPAQFRVTHLATGAAASRVEDGAYDLALSLACPVDVASATVGPITPVELQRFSIE